VSVRKLFISYARENRRDVDQLVGHLGILGYDTWVDTSLRGGQEWWAEILRRIADCDVFIAIISRDGLDSTACRNEFDWAVALDKPVLPVAVEPLPTTLPRRFAIRQIVDYSDPGKRADAALILAGGLATLPPAPPLPEPLPEAPATPLSYLTDLVDLVSQPEVLSHQQQRQILIELEPSLHSVDPHERRSGADILDRYSRRDDLYADVDRTIARFRATAAPETEPSAPSRVSSSHVAPGVLAGAATPSRRDDQVPPPPAPLPQPVGHQPGDLRQAVTQLRPPGGPPVPPPRPADRPPPEIGTPPPQRWWRRQSRPVKVALITVITVITVYLAGLFGHLVWLQATSTAYTVLPFTGLNYPSSVAVDSAGDVYVSDCRNNRVVKLATGSSTPTVLPFTGLRCSGGVAVDSAGDVYVTDYGNNRVVELAAGSSTQTVLPFTGLNGPGGAAVDSAGDLYVTDVGNNRVLKLGAGSPTQSVLPFTGLSQPVGVAVDAAGDLYVADDSNNRVVKLAAGSATQTVLPFTGVYPYLTPWGVAVDTAGNVYVTDLLASRVVKLAAGSSTQTVLPFTDVFMPYGMAVDTAGNVYVTDAGNNRVVKLPAG
jgi:sugar lactone lactonase YvrE